MAVKEPETSESSSCRSAVEELAELCGINAVSIDLIERSHDLDELLDHVFDEYERRLESMSSETDDSRTGPKTVDQDSDLRALVMFASQAAALKEKAAAATELRRMYEEQERISRQLDCVLAALDAAILVVAEDGTIRHANRAAGALTGRRAEELIGQQAAGYLGPVARGGNGEVVIERGDGEPRVMLVSRRDLGRRGDGEVVLLNDVTEHDRQLHERHREDKMSELLRTLGVLSHKINNPLTSLMGRAQILQMKKGLDPQVRKAADVIDESSRRIASYIRELAQIVEEQRPGALDELLEITATEGPERTRR
jgi:PAS domain S-box-containing protein